MKNHPCITKMNTYLAPTNGKLSRPLEITTKRNVVAHIQIATEKLDSKKKGRPSLVVATYCPFCGMKLQRDKSGRED